MHGQGSEVNDASRDLSYLHYPFLDPDAFVQARAWLTWTPPRRPAPLRLVPIQVPLSRLEQAVLDEWENRYGIGETERDVWLAAGLSVYEPHLAVQCFRAGLTVFDLAKTVDGRKVVWWLRSGESADSVRARLMSAGA